MSVDPSQLLSPIGPIDPSFFPGVDSNTLTANLNAYITDGQNKGAALPLAYRDSATLQWALWRAFDAIALRLATQPLSASEDGESYQYSSGQAKLMRDRAQIAHDGFTAIVQLATATDPAAIVPAPMGAVPLVFYS